MLTILAPCILPLLPIIIGGSLLGDHKVAWRRTALIVLSLAASVFIFSMALRASTILLDVPQQFWQLLSGGIVFLLGVHFLFPRLWTWLVIRLHLHQPTDNALRSANSHEGSLGAILTGAALGPVFTSCSPTYALILAAILPVSLAHGVLYLIAYILGMSMMLILVAYFGITLTRKLSWSTNENGIFRRVLGVIFVIVGISIILGLDKGLQVWLLERGAYDGTSGLEEYITPSKL